MSDVIDALFIYSVNYSDVGNNDLLYYITVCNIIARQASWNKKGSKKSNVINWRSSYREQYMYNLIWDRYAA